MQILEDRATVLRRVNRVAKAALEENKDHVFEYLFKRDGGGRVDSRFPALLERKSIFFCSRNWGPNCCWFKSIAEIFTAGGGIEFGMVDMMVTLPSSSSD